MRGAIILILATACHGGASAPADAPPAQPDATPDAAVDAAVNAMPDAAPPVLVVDVDAGNGPITAWSFPATAIGQRAAVTLVVHNPGATTTGVLGVSLVGADAGDFAIVGAGSTCDGRALVAGDPCVVRLAFTPTATSTRVASLRLTAGGAQLDVPLDGAGVAAPSGLMADASAVDFGPIELAQPGDAGVVLHNLGAGDLTLGARTASGGFAIAADDCPTTLAAGGTCTVTIRFTPGATGLASGALDVASSAGDAHVTLLGFGLRRITIDVTGTGIGTITSVPSGIDCGTACTALFFGAVTLTATPSDPQYSSSWGAPCGIDPICALPDGGDLTIDATFDTISPKVTVTFAGQGRGYLLIVDTQAQQVLATCTDSCAMSFFPGNAVTLYAFTPSTFAGWSGACTGTADACDLGALDRNLAVTVTFDRSDHEIATILPSAIVTGLVLSPDGNVVVADAAGVTKLTPAGAVVWTHAIAGGATDLAIDGNGDVFGRGGGGLFALSPAGAPSWSRTFATAGIPGTSMNSAVAASGDGTVIAALTGDGAHVVDGSGADRFVASGLGAQGVAVAADGTVAIPISSTAFPGQTKVVRYSAAGAALASIDPLDGDTDVSIAYGPQSYLLDAITGFGGAVVSRFSPALANVFSHFESTGAPATLPAAVAADATGDVVFLRELYAAILPPGAGYQLEVLSPGGAVTWTHARGAGVTPSALAAGDQRFAVAGTMDTNDPSILLPWIQIYATP